MTPDGIAAVRDGAMGDVISLNQARKAREKNTRERQAAANRVRFGRTKGERQRVADEQSKLKRDLDSKTLETTGDDKAGPKK
jgi:hypothetical protein